MIGDNGDGARAIAAHLLAGGHRFLAFLVGTADSSTNAAREAGFTEYLAERRWPTTAGTWRVCVQAQHGRYPATTAAQDRPVARHEFGLDVGREISIAGYDDVPMAA